MKKPVRITFGEKVKELAKDYFYIACNADTKCCSFEDFGLDYPEREVSIGIAEQNLMGVATGIASCGNKVILSTYSNFAILRACEQVRTYICNANMNVMIMGTHAGLQTGSEGVSHTAIEDIAIARSFPNMTVIQPSDNISAVELAKHAVEFRGPIYVRLPYDAVDNMHKENYTTQIGRIEKIKEFGSDVAIFVTGIMLGKVLKAAEILNHKGIRVSVYEVHTLKPIDEQMVIEVAKKVKGVVTVEDHSIYGGLGGIISEILSEHHPVRIKRIGIQDRFVKSADAEELYKEHNMTVIDILNAVEVVNG